MNRSERLISDHVVQWLRLSACLPTSHGARTLPVSYCVDCVAYTSLSSFTQYGQWMASSFNHCEL